uniref:Uncharacterized protein ycf23 n=1 Tax=Gronococcus sybilensis TaxID=3028029 RepID=A0A9Y1I2I6_9RHOD|nr:hypothetical protein GRSY_061 [Gronococcus sybilensis]
MTFNSQKILSSIQEKKAFKVISGINNLKVEEVIKIAEASEAGDATYIDIAANPSLVYNVRAHTVLPICVSTIDPNNLAQCIAVGADAVEIGNYECFYSLGHQFSATAILQITSRAKELLGGTGIPLTVTIPHILPIEEQVSLALKLEAYGVDMIQTEGKSVGYENNDTVSVIAKANYTLAMTYEVSKVCSLPIITSSGLSDLTAPMAIGIGASGVGIGDAISSLATIEEMTKKIRQISGVIHQFRPNLRYYNNSIIS